MIHGNVPEYDKIQQGEMLYVSRLPLRPSLSRHRDKERTRESRGRRAAANNNTDALRTRRATSRAKKKQAFTVINGHDIV